MDSLERLQGLYADLQAFTETRLANIDRLSQELQESVQELRKLLDKSAPSASEREAYNSGKITSFDVDYSINDEFRHLSRAVGTTLDLDEVEACKLLIEGSSGQESDNGYFVAEAVSRFHDRRDLVLQILRIAIDEAINFDREDGIRDFFRDIVAQTLNIKTGPPSNGSAFTSRCLKAMEDVETWLGKVNEQIQTRQLLSQMRGPEFYATLEFQRGSLFKQHEALGAILALLFRGNFTVSEDLHKLHAVVKRWQRLDILWIHYLPAFSSAFRQYGSPEGSTAADDAKRTNQTVSNNMAASSASPARPLHAVIEIWWTVEYSGWFREPTTQDQGSAKRSATVKTALDDHALEFLLSICTGIHLDMWRHSARQELVALLIGDQSGLAVETDQQTSSYFYTMLMESIEAFAEAWITNMPDSIRQLKNEEDDKRLLQITAAQDGVVTAAQRDQVGRLSLESFLVLIAFAFEGRPDSAEQFWEDPDSNLFGFLTWASKRQTVPRVSAFCEMLCAISEGPENAQAAHKFLLDEFGAVTTSRSRRVPTMNYQQVFAELDLYARKVHEKTPVSQAPRIQGAFLPDLNEVESPVMLSCYLRLLAHLFRHNLATRQYVLANAGFDFPRALLLLASGPIPSYLRATVFRTLEALLSDKDSSIANNIWQAIDDWASSSHDNKAAVKTGQIPERSSSLLQTTLSSIAASFDQYDAFIDLLRCLLAPSPTTVIGGQPLPFPADLGSGYRRAGVTPYIDFVCDQIFVKLVRELGDDTQAHVCSYHCLDFMAAGLEGFDENYVTMLSKNSKELTGSDTPAPDHLYARCHPFGRIMQWLFSPGVNKALLQCLHGKIDEIQAALPDDPIILKLVRAIDIINVVLDLQPTYFDLIKPVMKETDLSKGINFAGYTSFEESVISRSDIILNLCQYSASNHLQLTLRSLALLQKLTGSTKLNNQFAGGAKGQAHRVIDMLGPNINTILQPVADSLTAIFQIDIRELEDGFAAPGYLMKDGVLAFLNSCLGIQTELPSVAHILLGFGRIGNRLTITPTIDNGDSLFSSISHLVTEYPDGENGDLASWLIHMKSASMRTLQHLWTAPVSADLTLGQLRRSNFLAAAFASQTIVSQGTIWDGHSIADPGFWYTTSAEALTEFLSLRACFYDYAAREINSIGHEKLISLQRQVVSTLQGKSSDANGTPQPHLTIFDMFDFADLDTSAGLDMPQLQYFTDANFETFSTEVADVSLMLYDIGMVRSFLQMIQTQILDQQIQNPQQKSTDQGEVTLEADNIIGLLEARNRWTLMQKAKREALHNYVDMIVSAIEIVSVDIAAKTQFILHILQIVLPKLDSLITEESLEAIELARAADSLLLALSQKSTAAVHNRVDDIITDRLFQLFRICIDGIPMSNTSLELRTMLYSICSQYLVRITGSETMDSDPYRKARSNSMDTVRSASQHLISVISDDAEDGTDTCRLNALNLLSMLTSLARSLKSNLVVDALLKANTIEVLLEPLRNITSDFAATSAKHRPFLLTIFEARMFLLLQTSRTRPGATALLDSGLLQALRDSMIFRADPDLGMDLEISSQPSSNSIVGASNSALLNYFILLSSSLRVLLSTFSSRGPENEQIQYLVRNFLADHRANMVGVFKRAAGVSAKAGDAKMRHVIDESVRCYTGLAVGCGFVDFEDESGMDGFRVINGFS